MVGGADSGFRRSAVPVVIHAGGVLLAFIRMTAAARWLLTAFVLIGLVASAASTYVHVQLLGDPTYVTFCDVNDILSCTRVYLSQYGSLSGVPVAYLGFVWFAFVGALLLAARLGTAQLQEHLPTYLFVLSTLALAFVIYLGYASFVVLGVLCMLCVTVYAAVAGLFVVSGASSSISMLQMLKLAPTDIGALAGSPIRLGVVAMFVVGSGLGATWFASSTDHGAVVLAPTTLSGAEREEFLRWWSAQPRVELPIADDVVKVLVVKFNDYMCPPCRQTYVNYQSVFAKYQDASPLAVRLVTKHYPLDPNCNEATPNGVHYGSCEAAAAVLLAGRGGESKVKALEDWLFEHQATLTPTSIKVAARDVGGVNDFEAEYLAILGQVREDVALGVSLGVEATPTFVINGVRVTGGLTVPYFDAAIAYELEQADASR